MPDPALISKIFPTARGSNGIKIAGQGLGPLFAWSEPRQKNDVPANYQKYVSPNPPRLEPTSLRASGVQEISGKVWVNTRSGKYWKPGSRYYGKTKQGEYMSEQEAIQKEYQPASNLYLII